MKNIKLIMEYDGTNYCGWQIQDNAVTIEQIVENALHKITGEKQKVNGSSRTDSGVHARGFVGNFLTDSNIPSDRFRDILNSKLPQDIVIIKSEEVQLDFNARFHSKGKTYSYTILNRQQRPAINRNYVYYYRKKLDINAMEKAAKCFIGTHDFVGFKSNGSITKTTIRTIREINIDVSEDNIIFYITGDGFLYNMVRIMMGTLLQVGTGKKNPENISSIILSKRREEAGPCLPASGLCLEKVYYWTNAWHTW